MLTKIGASWLSTWLCVLSLLCISCRSKEAEKAAPAPGAAAQAEQEPIRVGVLAPFSGPFGSLGAQIEGGIKAYLQTYGDVVEGRKIELLVRDTTGIAPDVAKRLAQGLIVRDKVAFLAGFALTPNAVAVAPLATESKTPMVIMN